MRNLNDTFRIRTADNAVGPDILVCVPLVESRVPHGFTLRWRRLETRKAGESFGLLGQGRADRKDLADSLGLRGIAYMKQVHATRIRRVFKPWVHPPVCDGILTGRRGLGLLVRSADCVPLLMWDSRNNVVAAVHAGWRGTLARIAFLAVRYLEEKIMSRPDFIHVVMGPAIGRCCYEVGDEVFSAFAAEFQDAGDFFIEGRGARKQLDLIEANRRQLMEAGVPRSQIFSSDLCTSCENHILYSYRREGGGVGRLYGVIGVASYE